MGMLEKDKSEECGMVAEEHLWLGLIVLVCHMLIVFAGNFTPKAILFAI